MCFRLKEIVFNIKINKLIYPIHKMLESIIKGYKINEHRNDPKFRQKTQSTGEIIGSAIYLYFKPMIVLYQSIKRYRNSNYGNKR